MKNDAFGSMRYAKDPAFVSRRIAGEWILVPIRQKTGDLESIYTLNEVAGHIWEMIDGKITAAEMAGRLVETFEVTTEEAETDLEAFLGELESIGAAGPV